ncbi:hypothetical protein SAMN05444280_12410 [Tangfeifania diversioriginum]|uniref:Uncharacterized protein n=1 Tax=Tangfeifania diversioriginum TaxID=1168035 RepID=A0A1M6KPK1_9BACT|nr:hypothetical protein SAMN05444280_12410 [Tangfeifania diversioriginum]
MDVSGIKRSLGRRKFLISNFKNHLALLKRSTPRLTALPGRLLFGRRNSCDAEYLEYKIKYWNTKIPLQKIHLYHIFFPFRGNGLRKECGSDDQRGIKEGASGQGILVGRMGVVFKILKFIVPAFFSRLPAAYPSSSPFSSNGSTVHSYSGFVISSCVSHFSEIVIEKALLPLF